MRAIFGHFWRLGSIILAFVLCISGGTAHSCDWHRTICDIEAVENDPSIMNMQIRTVAPAYGDLVDAVEHYFDRAGRVVRLSTTKHNQMRHPVSFSKENFNQAEYNAASSRYLSVKDCLIERERQEAQPDLTRFDWENIPNHGAAHLCFQLVFTSYETAADVHWWLARQRMIVGRHFTRYRLPESSEANSRNKMSKDFGLTISGGFPNLPYGGPLNPWPLSVFEHKGYGVFATFSKTLGLVGLGISAHGMK